jgi:hypothetical protein
MTLARFVRVNPHNLHECSSKAGVNTAIPIRYLLSSFPKQKQNFFGKIDRIGGEVKR